MLAVLNVDRPAFGSVPSKKSFFSGKLAAGSVVRIIGHSDHNPSVVMIQKPAGGFKAWCHLDNMTPVEE